MYVLGINCWLHDAAVALLRDGAIVAAMEEERWFRDDKHTGVFPARSIRWALGLARQSDPGLRIDHVAVNMQPALAFGDNPSLLHSMRLDSRLRKNHAHLQRAMDRAVRELRNTLRAAGANLDYTFHEVPHHDAHAASCFFVSPFEEAAILTLDGLGEWATTTMQLGRGNRLQRLRTIGLPHSMGTLYAAVTEYLGFKRNNDEYKVMGLASYGDPAPFRDRIAQLIRTTDDGGFEINPEHFDVHAGVLFPGPALERLLGGPPRVAESELTERDKDIAAALQEKTEEVGLHLARHLQKLTGQKNLCMAGGVALNCCMNARILNETDFEQLYVQPASYDAGGALGAASYVSHQLLGQPRGFVMDRASWGPEYSDAQIEAVLKEGMLRYRRCEDVAVEVARLLADAKIVGWVQGRAEWGPRALGHRSILADPTNPTMQDHVNLRVKHREDFRPFAPSVAHEAFSTYFETAAADDPFMTKIVPVRPEWREKLPAITHVDGTARVQTVRQETNPLYHRMLHEFAKLRGVPIVLNTSFNVRGEPMVLQPKDALRCFFTTGIDHLALGSFIVDK